MPPSSPSPLLRVWYRWKMLRLPWRRKFLVGTFTYTPFAFGFAHTRKHTAEGLDLHGNTFWEFRLSGSSDAGRWRRIVRYARSTHYGDVNVSPAWHQWLRHTRAAPPSLAEQHANVAREERMKVLAAEADARWEGKPSLIDAPGEAMGQPQPALGASMQQSSVLKGTSGGELGTQPSGGGAKRGSGGGAISGRTPAKEQRQPGVKGLDPWKQAARKGPSEEFQPKAWQPPAATPKKP